MPTIVRFGNAAPHQLKSEDPVDLTIGRDALVSLAASKGLTVADDDTDETIAARIDAVRTKTPLDIADAVTEYQLPDGLTPGEIVTEIRGAWPTHSDQPAAWVSTDDPVLTARLKEDLRITGDAPTTSNTPEV